MIFAKNFAKKLWKKNNTWNIFRPSDPVYYIEDCRISSLVINLELIICSLIYWETFEHYKLSVKNWLLQIRATIIMHYVCSLPLFHYGLTFLFLFKTSEVFLPSKTVQNNFNTFCLALPTKKCHLSHRFKIGPHYIWTQFGNSGNSV